MGNYSSALNAEHKKDILKNVDVEDFKSIISTLESQRILIEHHSPETTQTLNHDTAQEQTGLDINEVRPEPDLLALKFLFSNTDTPNAITEPGNQDLVQNCPNPVDVSSSSCLPALISAALSGSLPVKSRPVPQGPLTMEQMKVQLGELRNELDLLKAQHKKEITLLMNELDEEKKVRLSLQIDVERLKKHMSK